MERVIRFRTHQIVATAIAVVVTALLVFAIGLGTTGGPGPHRAAPSLPTQLLSTTVTATTDLAIYMQIAGVPGEVTASGYNGAIDIDSWNWAIAAPGSGPAETNGATITTPVSRAIPLLMEAVGNHTEYGGNSPVTVTFVKTVSSAPVPLITVSLSDVHVSSVNEAASAGSVPQESIALTFAQISYIYKYTMADGQSSNIQFCWNFKVNASCLG